MSDTTNSVQVNWDDQWLVGCAEIDREHKQMLHQLNALALAIDAGESNENLIRMTRQFFDYCVEHFLHEEAEMRKIKHLGYQQHKVAHERLLYELQALCNRVADTSFTFSATLVNVIRKWAVSHFVTLDKDLLLDIQRHTENSSRPDQ